MGNRALIVPKGMENIGVYLHWNGGLDSVTAFLKYCEMRDFRHFGGENADGYGLARFIQVVGNYFGGGLSLGVQSISDDLEKEAEWLDNGIYIVDKWEIVQRIGYESGHEGYDLTQMLIDIDKAQPKKEQLTEGYIRAEEVDPTDLEIGDEVYFYDYVEQRFTRTNVVGLGNCAGYALYMPYVDMYPNHDTINPNNFIREKVRKVKD